MGVTGDGEDVQAVLGLSGGECALRMAVGGQVCTELDNHVGVGDKTLAEFIIDLAEKHDNVSAFQRALEENGAEFPDSFVTSLHALIVRLLPKKVPLSQEAAAKKNVENKSTEKFPGLAMKNSKPLRMTPSPPKMPPPPPPPAQRDDRDSRGGRDDRDRYDRDDRGGRGDDRGGRGGDRDSRDRRDDDRRGGRGDDRRDDRRDDDRRGGGGRPPMPPPPVETEPVLGGVYKGTVQNGEGGGRFVVYFGVGLGKRRKGVHGLGERGKGGNIV